MEVIGLWVYFLGFFLSIPLALAGLAILAWQMKRVSVWFVLVAVATILIIVMYIPFFVGPPGTPVPATTVTSTTTVRSP